MADTQTIMAAIMGMDSKELAIRIAALQLCPENADTLLRLETISNLVASTNHQGKKPSGQDLNKLCNKPPLTETSIILQEDPFENVFSEDFMFFGGSYIVFPGMSEAPTYILRNLCKAIFLNNSSQIGESFTRKAQGATLATLLLSNMIACRAGIRRNTLPKRHDGKVYIPTSKKLSQLCEAVQFTIDELCATFTQVGITPLELEPFFSKFEELDATYTIESDEGPLHRRPLLKVGDNIIVAMPCSLLSALRHYLITLSFQCGVSTQVSTLYRMSIWDSLKESLGILGNHQIPVQLPAPSTEAPYVDGVFNLDSDKLLYVILTTDDFTNYNPGTVFCDWVAPNLDDVIKFRTKEIIHFLITSQSSLDDVLTLYVYSGIGRVGPVVTVNRHGEVMHQRNFDTTEIEVTSDPQSLKLALSGEKIGNQSSSVEALPIKANELETISFLEGTNQLLLWKFVHSGNLVRKSTQIVSFSVLDEYYLYRKFGHSYYMSDGELPNVLYIQPGSGAGLRWEVIEKFDFHGVIAAQHNRMVEVILLYGDRSIPIYAPRFLSPDGGVQILVETGNISIWISSPDYNEHPTHQILHRMYFLLADAISFWMWKAMQELYNNQHLKLAMKMWDRILIKLNCMSPENWSSTSRDDRPVDFHIDEFQGVITLNLYPSVEKWLKTENNEGERRIMIVAIEAFFQLLQLENPNILNERLDPVALVDTIAPVGIQKKILLIDSIHDPALDNSNTPKFRPVQNVDEDALLDELGSFLRSELHKSTGPISDDRRVEMLQKVVGFFYSRLQSLVRSMDGKELLQVMVSMSESMLQRAAQVRLTMPTRIACFGPTASVIKSLVEEIQEADKSNLSIRFLIEYIVAQPPNGIRPFSLSVCDRLLAICSKIVEWAYVSDLIRYELADIKLTILPSGRLGQTRDGIDLAYANFSIIHTEAEIEKARSSFGRNWGVIADSGNMSESVELVEMEKGCLDEFGFSLTDMHLFLSATMDLGENQETPTKALGVDEFIRGVAQFNNWDSQKCLGLLDLFSLGPRKEYLQPPPNFRTEDIYPWRYNRPLSYARRPLLRKRDSGEDFVVWGNRQLWKSALYLNMILFTGRIHGQAMTKGFQHVLGKIHHKSGEIFNDQVADAFRDSGVIVIPRLKKVGKLRIGLPESDLGDIDVLVINTRLRRILVIECKDFVLARNPHEIYKEMVLLYRGDGKKDPAVVKVQKRANWIRCNLQKLLLEHHLPIGLKWRIESLVVVSQDTLTPLLSKSSVPTVSLRNLPKFIRQWRT